MCISMLGYSNVMVNAVFYLLIIYRQKVMDRIVVILDNGFQFQENTF